MTPHTLFRLAVAQRVILTNAASLVGTTAVTAGFGYVYWWLAAREFPPEAVGLAAAVISAMTLLGTMGALGLGTLLITELPRRRGQELALIVTALLAAGAVAAWLGVIFAYAAPRVIVNLESLAAGPQALTYFAAGVGLTAAALVLDQALIGLLLGQLQLARNLLFALSKLGALVLAAAWYTTRDGEIIISTYVLGAVVSVAAGLLVVRRGGTGSYRPEWGLLRGLGRAALSHHALNVALQVPHLTLPILVTAVLSATMNAYFYVAWMVASLVFIAPGTLTTVLHAVGVRDPQALAARTRFTLALALAGGLLANAVLLLGADLVVGVLSSSSEGYADHAGSTLRILGFGVLPLIVKDHYVAIYRIHNRVRSAVLLVAVGGALELGMAALGAHAAGLLGLSLGWVAGLSIEAVLMAGPVYRTAIGDNPFAPPRGAGRRELQMITKIV